MNRPPEQPHNPQRAHSRPSDRGEYPPLEELGCALLAIGTVLLAVFALVMLVLWALGVIDPFS